MSMPSSNWAARVFQKTVTNVFYSRGLPARRRRTRRPAQQISLESLEPRQMLSVNPASSGSSASSAKDTSSIAAFVSQNSVGILAIVHSPPQAVVATSGNAQLAVTWAAPSSQLHGGRPVAEYLVKYSSNNGVAGSWTRYRPGSPITATSCTVTGLTNGTPYVITVIAKDAAGISLPSDNSAPATPLAAALTPKFGATTRTATGFTVPITNYNAAYTWAGTATASGSVAISGTGLVTVTGVALATSSTATITTTRTGYARGSATVTATSLAAAWAYSTRGGSSSNINYYPKSALEFANAGLQGYVTYNTPPAASPSGAGWFNKPDWSTSRGYYIYTTYASSSTDQTLLVANGGDDGHSVFVDNVFIAGGGFAVRAYSSIAFAAGVARKITVVGYNASGVSHVSFSITDPQRTSAVVLEKVPGISMTPLSQAAALTPKFGATTRTATGFTVPITNYNAAYTWTGTATALGSVAISGTGLVTVTGVAAGTKSTATIITTKSNTVGGSATVTATSLAAMSMVTVGNPGNATDTDRGTINPEGLYGDVSYSYQIGKYDVTGSQYTAFLNAVGSTDTYALYNANMGTNTDGAQISRSGTAGSYTYAVMKSSGQRPITFVSWFDCARFSNWMSNGTPNGAQVSTTTENGAYNVNGATSGNAVAKNATNPNTGSAPTFWIPLENEWYKAAYYSPNYSGSALTPTFTSTTATADGFRVQISNYSRGYTWAGTATASGLVSINWAGQVEVTGVAAGTNSTATITTTKPNTVGGTADVAATSLAAALNSTFGTTTATADGFTAQITNYDSAYTWAGGVGGYYYAFATQSDTDPGTTIGGSANQANYLKAFGHSTDVGSFSGSGSFYGTFDQSGNVWQWNDLDGTAGSARGRRGGAWSNYSRGVSSSYPLNDDPSYESDNVGFRLASPVTTTLTPAFGSTTATANGFTVQISNYDSSYTWAGTATASGSVVVSGTGLVTVTGVAANTSSTATITTTKSNTVGGSAAVTATATSVVGTALTPTFGTQTATSDGFTVVISNYSSAYTWAGTANASGTVGIIDNNDGTGLATVTGVAAGTSSTATITTTRTGYTSGSATVTAISLSAALTPTFGSTSPTATGFTVQITNYDSSYSWAGTATASGSVVVSGTGLVTVTGLAAATSSTATITTTKSNTVGGSADVTATSLAAALTPTFGSTSPTANGFTVQISNFDASYTWAGTATASGSVLVSSTGLVTVTGVAAVTSSTATITTTRTGYIGGSATVTATSLPAALTPAFGATTSTANGFTVQISNFDANYAWAGTATASGSVAINGSGLVTVTGVAAGGVSSTATITTTRTGYTGGTATVTGGSIVLMSMVTVGNPGNAADTTGYGDVSYSYQIGKYDVTGSQYTAFLNAVGSTDTYALYNASMGTNTDIAQISQSGSSGSYTYAVMNGTGSRPVTYVSWFDSARFSNWMSNGQPSGAQNDTTTENGAYYVNGATTGNAVAANTTNLNTGLAPTYQIPLENEWYKAAYYSPNYGGTGVGGYYRYATQSDTDPGTTIGSTANQANYDGAINYATDVGSFSGSGSFYGTFDQSGNVWQWNDLDGTAGSARGCRGGDWTDNAWFVSSSFRRSNDAPSAGPTYIGFRLASPV